MFSHDFTGIVDFGKGTREMKGTSYTRVHDIYMTLIPMLFILITHVRWYLSGFSIVK